MDHPDKQVPEKEQRADELVAHHGAAKQAEPTDPLDLVGTMVFDAKKCERGIDALTMYKYNYDMEKKILGAKPVHDWASHGADALRTGAGTKDTAHRRERPELPQVAII